MDKINKTIAWMIGIIFALLTVLGILIIYKPESQQQAVEKKEERVAEEILDECTEQYEKIDEEIAKANSETEKISPNCELILIKYYKNCKDTINEYIHISEDLVNASREDLQKRYSDWEIKEFSNNKISLYKEFEGSCGEHYILKNEQGKISIYKLDETGKESLYEKTEVSIDYLPEKDKNAIKNGLKINGKEKLNELIESFE